MTQEEIKVGSTYEGASGARKKVAAIEGAEGTSRQVRATVTKAGTGKGKHSPVGTEGVTRLNAFAAWALKEVTA